MKTLSKQLIQFIFLSTFLWGCNSPVFLNGKYVGKHNPNIFVFFQDSVFNYEYTDFCFKESSGKWTRIGNKLYLNSFNQEDSLPIRFTKMKAKTNLGRITVAINLQTKNKQDYSCIPIVNKQPLIHYPKEGDYVFESELTIDSLRFLVTKNPYVILGTGSKSCFNPVQTKTIKANSIIGDSILVDIGIVDSLFSYQVFKNKELIIKRGGLTFKQADKNNLLHLKQT